MRFPWQVWYQIWCTAVFGRHKATVEAMLWIFGLPAAFGLVAGPFANPAAPARGAGEAGGFFLLLVSFTIWSYFMSGAAALNHPSNAGLVPGLNRHIQWTAVMTGAVTMVLVLPLAYGAQYGAMELLFLLLAFCSSGFAQSGRKWNYLVQLVAILSLVLIRYEVMQAWTMEWPAILLGLMLMSCYAGYELRASFPRGGERHWKQMDDHRRVLSYQDMTMWHERRRLQGDNRITAWLLQRRLQARRGGATLILDGLGPGNRATLAILAALAVVVIAVALRFYIGPVVVESRRVRLMGYGMVMFCVGGVAAMAWSRFARNLRSTAGEQGLLRLCPGMPAAERITRELALRITRVCLLEWFLFSLTIMTVIAVWGADRSMFQGGAAFSTALLFFIGQSLDDYARATERSSAGNLIGALVMTALVPISMVVRQDLGWWIFWMSVILAIAITTFVVRWREMMEGPVAFPAGRAA